jgi:hypothetical protein
MKNLFKLAPVFLLALASCSKDVELPANDFSPAFVQLTPTSPTQFNASIDGVPFSLALDDSTFIELTDQGGPSSGDTVFRVYHSIIQDTVLDEPAAWVRIGTNKFIITVPSHILPTPIEFNSYFSDENRRFADTAEVKMDGAALYLRDTLNGGVWTTQGPQPGSLFRVDQFVADTIAGQHHIKARMVFRCTLYNSVTGGTRNLTNGVFVGWFRNG